MCSAIDACIIGPDQRIILLVQEDKRYLRQTEPVSSSGAIAAFQAHNIHQFMLSLSNTVNQRTTPGIVKNGSMPTYYKVNVSAALVRAVGRPQCPTHPITS